MMTIAIDVFYTMVIEIRKRNNGQKCSVIIFSHLIGQAVAIRVVFP